jgi:hypothetical protein
MITSESIADFVVSLVSWQGAVFLTALFLLRRYRKKLWKARKHLKVSWKWLKWSCIPFLACLAVLGQESHIAVSRVLLLLLVMGYRSLWNHRYAKARGKQRAVYHLVEGEDYTHRERMAREAGEQSVNQAAHHARYRPVAASQVVQTEAGDERLIGQLTSVLDGIIWRRQNQKRRAYRQGLF